MLTCHDCRSPYGSWPDYYVEPETWAKHSPSGNEGGLLCLNCFAQRMAVRADANQESRVTLSRVNPIFAAKVTGTADRDTDRSGEADETAKQTQPKARAGAEGIAK